jgi:DNA-binding response OmpR family regulator
MTTPRVLVVDDDETMLSMLRVSLAGRPFEAVFCDSGLLAMALFMSEVAEGRCFQAFLFDCALPHFDGFTMTRLVRLVEQTGVCPRATVAVFTAYTKTVERSTLFEESGADFYLRKPEDVNDVPGLVESWVARAEGGCTSGGDEE